MTHAVSCCQISLSSHCRWNSNYDIWRNEFSRESSLQRQTECWQLLWKLLILTFAIKTVKLTQLLLCGRRFGKWICRCVLDFSLKPRQHNFAPEVPQKFLKFQWTSVQEVVLNFDELTFVSVADGYQLKEVHNILFSIAKTRFEGYDRFLKIKTLKS